MNQETSSYTASAVLRKLVGHWATGTWLLVAGCHGAPAPELVPAAGGQPAKPVPTALLVTRHFAQELARGTRYRAADAPRYADSLFQFGTSGSLSLYLPTCQVESYLEPDKTLKDVFIRVPLLPPGSQPTVDRARPNPARLLRLGELRRTFGPGKIDRNPLLTKEEFTRSYPVTFRYQPTPGGRPVVVHAALPTAAYADSAWVNSISLYRR